MSETIEAPKAAQIDIPNFAVTEPTCQKINGLDYQVRTITFGEPKQSIEVRDLDEADEWDLSEVAGDNAMNTLWMARASAAWGVEMIDGDPVVKKYSDKREIIRYVLRRIGRNGVFAIWRMMQKRDGANVKPAPDSLAVAKNS